MTHKLVNEAANDSAQVSGQEPIRLQDLENSACLQAWKKWITIIHQSGGASGGGIVNSVAYSLIE